MSKVTQLSDAIAERKVRQIKLTDERRVERKQILKEAQPVKQSTKADLSKAVKILEYKLAQCEESFYDFTKSNFDGSDAFAFTAFLFSHMRNFVDALSLDETGEESIICMEYLKHLSEKAAATYLNNLIQ